MAEFVYDLPAPNTAQLAEEVRDNLNALGTTNATADPTRPKRPRNGMLRILAETEDNLRLQLFWGSWRTIIQNLGEVVSNIQRYDVIVSVPAEEWVIDHNLGVYPIVQCIDPSGHVLVPESIQHVSPNRVIITHSAEYTGRAIFIG